VPTTKCLHSLRWFVSLCRGILDIAIGHMPMVRAEVAVGGLIGASLAHTAVAGLIFGSGAFFG